MQYERSFRESHFIRDPLRPTFIDSRGIEEHRQLDAGNA
jgi:hypothetical protein